MKPKVMIAMPTRSGPDETAENAVERASIAYGAPLIRPRIEPRDKARNVIANRFLTDAGQYDYLLFVDDDTVIPEDSIERLLAVKQPVVSGVQPLNMGGAIVANVAFLPEPGDTAPHWPEWWGWDRPTKPYQIGACGFGCILIHRWVFETLPWPWFAERIVDRAGLDHRTEDVFFCMLCHDANIPIWCEPTVVCGHRKRVDLTEWVPRKRVHLAQETKGAAVAASSSAA